MPYVSLYRKYRPQTFEDVVGQEHVTTTLRNAVAAGHLASGYLFCGTRGTAKTTCARILAKALNCVGPGGDRSEMTPEPCGVCEPCQSIASSAFVDVLELDAASHGKVDDVRDLVASIKFPPMQGRYKVYIIDEAHQLSRDAMDAFLKTLEEPPHRTVFILATTELEKLPITIASRCQVFEFKRGSVAQLAGRLDQIAKAEGVTASPAALSLVARAAEGSYRDALSLFEQVLAYKPGGIEASDVTTALGAIDEDVLDNLIGVMGRGDAAAVFTGVADLLTAGKDIRQVIRNLSSRLRDLLALRVGAQSATDVVETTRAGEIAASFAPTALLRALEVLAEAERDLRWNTQHRLLLETTLLRIAALGHEAAAPVRPSPAPSAPTRQPAVAAAPPPVRAAAAVAPAKPTLAADPGPPFLTEHDEDTDDTDVELVVVEADDSDVAPSAAPVDDDPSLPLPLEAAPDVVMQVQTVAAAPPAPVNGHAKYMAGPGAAPELLKLQRSWEEVINRMGSRSPAGVPLVRDAFPIALEKETFVLRFGSRFSIDRLESNPKGRKVIEEIICKSLSSATGAYKIRCVLGDTAPAKPATAAAASEPDADSRASDLVEEVIAVFGGRVVDDDESKR